MEIIMRITRQADYATRTIYYLSRLGPHQRVTTKTIAENLKIPSSFLSKTIPRLKVAGLMHTTRGARGGVSLARPPSNISVLDVVEAIDGPIVLHDCDLAPEDCPLHPFWGETQTLLVDQLQNATFDQFGPERNSNEF
jgi:Rrf2 family protein